MEVWRCSCRAGLEVRCVGGGAVCVDVLLPVTVTLEWILGAPPFAEAPGGNGSLPLFLPDRAGGLMP